MKLRILAIVAALALALVVAPTASASKFKGGSYQPAYEPPA